MAVDSTIHFLNYYRHRTDIGMPPATAARETVEALGPVILMSTLVLLVGLGSTVTSNMPTLQNFGMVSIVVLLVALIGDLLVLPATLALLGRRFGGRGRGAG
jgi:predicted RND superfamily exporter protein